MYLKEIAEHIWAVYAHDPFANNKLCFLGIAHEQGISAAALCGGTDTDGKPLETFRDDEEESC